MTVSLVTGGCGFVGRAVAEALKRRGDKVMVLDRAPTCPVEGVVFRQVDITDRQAVMEACRGVETIVHTASLVHTQQNQKEVVWAVNLGGTEHLLEAARRQGVTRFIHISSGSVVYQGHDIENGDERLPYAASSQAPYADSKIAAEKQVLAANGLDGMVTCALRPHVVFGPGDQRFLPAVMRQARRGLLRFQIGRGVWLSDYTYIDNLVDAVLRTDEVLAVGGTHSVAAGQAYFITNGEPIPFWDFVRKVQARLGFPPIQYQVPQSLAMLIATLKEGIDTLRGAGLGAEDGFSRFAIRYMCTHHYFSIEKARRELGWSPRVSLDEGIELTCRHLEAAGGA